MNAIEKKIREKIEPIFKNENTGHDMIHLNNVLSFGKQIQKEEGGDFDVVVASCLVHDLHRVMSNEQKRYVSPGESLERIEEILRDVGLSYEQIEKVVFAVFHHEDKFLKEELSVEAEILQDADALDALGEQGLKRALKFGKAKNLPVCKKDLPLLSSEFVPDINPISTVHYVFRVMIMQAENLFSKTAKKLAKSQVSILEDFVLKHMNN